MHSLSCENDFIYMRMKSRYHIKGRPLNLVLIQRPEGIGNIVFFVFFRDTPTSAGPNSFNKGNKGFSDHRASEKGFKLEHPSRSKDPKE